jgi:hypothetical protein
MVVVGMVSLALVVAMEEDTAVAMVEDMAVVVGTVEVGAMEVDI